MANELEQLKDLVARLQAENDQMRQEQEASRPGPGTSSDSSATTAPVTERLIYLPRDRKCPLFRGRGGLSIGKWTEEVNACIRACHLPPADQALFIYDHLEGEAKEEIKYRSSEERGDPNKVIYI